VLQCFSGLKMRRFTTKSEAGADYALHWLDFKSFCAKKKKAQTSAPFPFLWPLFRSDKAQGAFHADFVGIRMAF